MLVSRVFTCATHHILDMLWQSWKCSLRTASQFPQNDKKEQETLSLELDKLNERQTFQGIWIVNFNPKETFKTSCISIYSYEIDYFDEQERTL